MLKFNIIALVLTIYLAVLNNSIPSLATPLDDYVNTPDPHYKYDLIKTYEMTGYKIYILNMTSQKWLDETVVKNPIWWHFLCITIPDKIVRSDAAFMVISNGDNTNM